MLHFEGDNDLPQSPAELWAKLSDVRFMVHCIPGLDTVKRQDADEVVCTVKPAGLSFVSGSLELTARRVAAVENASAQVVITSKGIGSSSEVETGFTLAVREGGSRLHWTADIKKMGGLLKAVPQGLIRGAAQKIIADIWETVVAKLSAPPEAAAR